MIILILSQPLIIGLTRTEFTINMRPIFAELKFMYLMLLSTLVLLILQGFMQLDSLVDSMVGLDMIGILTWKFKFLNFHQEKFCKLFGMVLLSSLED